MDGHRNRRKVESFGRRILFATLVAASAIWSAATIQIAQAQAQQTVQAGQKPNILVIFGDDIGQTDVSAYSKGVMGYMTPNIDRIAGEGMIFTDYYAEQSCTAGRSSFITGQATLRTGLSKVGLPGADLGLRFEDITIAEALKPLGYATGQFGKNHLGDKNEFLTSVREEFGARAREILKDRADLIRKRVAKFADALPINKIELGSDARLPGTMSQVIQRTSHRV